MNHIIYGDNRISYLTKEEILNPFLILDIFNGKASDDDVQEVCWTLFSSAMRPAYWMKFESPLYLYECYKQIVRLIEAGYLIMQIRPNYLQKVKLGSSGLKPSARVNDEFTETLIETRHEAYRLLTKVNSQNRFYNIKLDLYDLLFESLEPDCVDYYSSLQEFICESYQDISKIIRSLFVLSLSDTEKYISKHDLMILEKHVEFAIDMDSSTFGYSDTIYEILERENAKDLISIADQARAIIAENNYWHTHRNPGNVLYYFHEFLFVIESFHEYIRDTPEITELAEIRWHIPEDRLESIRYLSRKQIKRPLKYILKAFREKSLSKWRSILEDWKQAVLSNRSDSNILDEARETHEFVVRLIEIASILEYQPDLTD